VGWTWSGQYPAMRRPGTSVESSEHSVTPHEADRKLKVFGVNRRVHNFGVHPAELINVTQTWVAPE